jgi:hypothetical protein
MIQDTLVAIETGVATLKNEITLFGQEQYAAGFTAGSAAGNGKLYSEEEKDALVAAAITSFKADILAQYEAQQVVESQSETGFANLLK